MSSKCGNYQYFWNFLEIADYGKPNGIINKKDSYVETFFANIEFLTDNFMDQNKTLVTEKYEFRR